MANREDDFDYYTETRLITGHAEPADEHEHEGLATEIYPSAMLWLPDPDARRGWATRFVYPDQLPPDAEPPDTPEPMPIGYAGERENR